MKEFFINFVKLFLSILIVVFIEEYFFKTLDFIGITLDNNTFIRVIIYLIEFVLIFIIYNAEIKSAFSKYQSKLGSNLLYTLISYIVIFIAMMIANYIIKLVANNINMNYTGLNFINIFNESFDFNLIVKLMVDMIIIPFVKVTIFVLGVNNLICSKAGGIISGLSYAIYEGLLIGGEVGYVFINVIDEFILFVLLSFIYKKNSNIAFSIITFIFYELFSALIAAKLL